MTTLTGRRQTRLTNGCCGRLKMKTPLIFVNNDDYNLIIIIHDGGYFFSLELLRVIALTSGRVKGGIPVMAVNEAM